MGNGMNKILEGVYIGNLHDSSDEEQLKENKITHILCIAKGFRHQNKSKSIVYKHIEADDNPDQKISQFFGEAILFIHKARSKEGSVLVHCMAGVSRSVTLVASYIAALTQREWDECINIIKGARRRANPNYGFQKQLQEWCQEQRQCYTEKLKALSAAPYDDETRCQYLLEAYFKCELEYTESGRAKALGDELYPLAPGAYKPQDNKPEASEAELLKSNSSDSDLANQAGAAEPQTVSPNCGPSTSTRRHNILNTIRKVLKTKVERMRKAGKLSSNHQNDSSTPASESNQPTECNSSMLDCNLPASGLSQDSSNLVNETVVDDIDLESNEPM